MINTDRIVSLFMDMVRIDSPSLDEKNMSEYLRGLLGPRGYTIRADNAGATIGGTTNNLVIGVAATGPGHPRAFSAHMDCVPPCAGIRPHLEDGVIRSTGDTVLGGDDKAGIAAILEALFHLEEENIPHPELELVFTVCEEHGLVGAKALDFSLVRSSEVVVLDAGGPVGTIIVRSPSKADMTIVFHGRAAHAGIDPENGVSAIQMAANAIGRMRLLRIDEETVANLGRIEGGGQTNIVADTVTLTGEARAYTEDKLLRQVEHMRQCCQEAAEDFKGHVDFTHVIAYPALDVAPDSVLLNRALRACARLGLPSAVKGTGGGSDANIFAGHGLSCINLGIGMSKVHTTDEFITVASLEQSARLTAELMRSE